MIFSIPPEPSRANPAWTEPHTLEGLRTPELQLSRKAIINASGETEVSCKLFLIWVWSPATLNPTLKKDADVYLKGVINSFHYIRGHNSSRTSKFQVPLAAGMEGVQTIFLQSLGSVLESY